MSRGQHAPWNFDCPYKGRCPHLEGLSTKWVWKEYQQSHDEHLEHWRVRDIQEEELGKALEYIHKLEKENEELKAKYQTLHRRQFQSNKKDKSRSSEKTSNESHQSPKRKKRGAPSQGHQGWCRRKPDHIDKTIVVEAPEVCPYCSCDHLTSVKETLMLHKIPLNPPFPKGESLHFPSLEKRG